MRNPWSLVVQTSGSRIYWVAAVMLTTVITSRYLGPEGRGVYVAAMGWVAIFATFGHFSLGQVAMFLATAKAEDEWRPPVLGSLLFITGIVILASWIVAALLYAVSDGAVFGRIDPLVLALVFMGLPALIWIEQGNGVLMAAGQLKVMNVAQVVGATATVVLTFLAVAALRSGVYGAAAAAVVAQLLTVVVSLGYLLRRPGGVRVERGVIRELLRGGTKLHLNAIGTYLFTQANVLILNYYRAPGETAFYQLALQLLIGVQIVASAAGSVAYSLVSREGPDAAWPRQRRLLWQVSGLVAILGAVGYLVAPWIIPLVFGDAFHPAATLFRIMVFGIIGISMSAVMASQWIGRGLFLQAALLTAFIGLLTVIANLLVVPAYGMYGAAWVTVGTYCAAIAGNGSMALWVESRVRKGARA